MQALATQRIESADENALVSSARRLRSGEEQRLRDVSRDFEALFIKMMLESMRATVPKSGMIDGGFAEEIYEDMLYEQYANKMADTAGLGLARTLYDQMSAYL
jgi:peptidoglycan hydrolase FlgJ